jgi:tetratricopeptide (TPR) repeat protein
VSIVTEDILDLLTHLVDKSLVVEQESSGEARYHMLETIRQYAREKLLASGEAEPIHSNHLGFYAQLAVKADPKLWSAEQGHWLDCLETELDNIRVGLEWGEASPRVDEVEAGLQLAGSLWQFWLVRGHWSEGREPLTRLLARADFPESTSLSATSLRARALNLAGVLAGQQGDFAQARQLHAEGLAIARQLEDQVNTAYASYGLGSISFLEGDFIGAHTHLENSLILFRKCDDKRGIAVALGNLGEVALRQNNLATARACFDESLAVCRQMGHKMGAAGSLNALGALSLRQGDLATAQDFFSEALTIFRELDDKPGMAESISGLSYVALRRGDYGTVRAMSEEALMINQKLGSKRAVAATLLRLGKATRCLNDHTLAHSYYEEGLTIFRELSLSGGISISLYNLGSLALLQGNHHQAELLFRESLTLALEKEDTPNIAYSYLGLAGVLASSGKSESFYQAARLLGQAEALFEASNTAFDEADCKDHDRTVGLLLEGLGEYAFNAARTEGQTMSFDQAVTVLYRLNGLWW